jgi:hypothetical protein
MEFLAKSDTQDRKVQLEPRGWRVLKGRME